MKKLKIGFTYDAKADYKLMPGDSADKFAEFDSEETISQIHAALESSGHRVQRIGNVTALLEKISCGERWDIVFNIAEGICGRNRESQVPAILEMLGIPYTGSDALTMGITLDKVVAKIIAAHYGILTPKFIEIKKKNDLIAGNFHLKFPLIVKPSEEGTSKGLSEDSIVFDFAHLKKRAAWVIEKYRQPALVEEFITGSEFTVAVIENDPPSVLPPVQITINGKKNLGYEFYTHKRVETNEVAYECPAAIPDKLNKKLCRIALDSFKALGIKDLCRIDIRVSEKGMPYFLECNTLPNLGEIDVFPLVAKAMGSSYNKILVKILSAALKRYGITK